MKISIFTDAFYPMQNGIVTSTISFIRELSNKGHQVQIYCPKQKGIEEFHIADNVEIIALRGVPAFFYPEFKITTFTTPKVMNNIRKFKPDIIHFHTQFTIGLKGIFAGKIFKTPVVGTYHTKIADERYLKNLGFKHNETIEKFAWMYNNFYYNQANGILAPSAETKQELIDSGINADKITVLYNPLPMGKTEIKYKFLDGIDGNILLYVGRISKEKNIETGIRIFEKVVKTNPDAKYVLVGDGPIRAQLEKEAKEKGLENNIIFLGGIPHEKLVNSDIFPKSTMFFTASLSEVMPMTIIEGIYFGLPLIGFAKGGIKELIRDGYNGFISKEGEEDKTAENISRILDDKKLQKKLSENSLEFRKNFDPSKLTDKLLELYQNTINGYKK